MSGIRKRVMGNGELGQTKEGGCAACEDSNSIFTNDMCGPMKEMGVNRKVVWGLFGKM